MIIKEIPPKAPRLFQIEIDESEINTIIYTIGQACTTSAISAKQHKIRDALNAALRGHLNNAP